MNLRKKVVKGIAWSAIQSWGARGISFFVFLALARLLEPESFGLVAMASAFMAFVQIFLDQGFADAIVQHPELEHEHLDTAFWTNMLIGGFLTLGGIAASGLVAKLFNEPQLAPIVGWLSIDFLLSALRSTQQAILKRDLKFKSLAKRSLVASVAGGIVGVVMAYLGYGVWSLVALNLMKGLAGVVVLWQVSNWRPSFSFSKNHFRELFVFGINVTGIKFLDFVNMRSDDLLIGYFLGPVALGYYTIGYRVFRLMIELLTGVTAAVAFPSFSRLQKEPEQMRRGFYTATRLTSFIAFPAFLGIAILAPEMVITLYGTQWAPSIPVMQVLAFIGILTSVSYFNGIVLKAVGKVSWLLGFSLLSAIANVIAFILVVRWGIVAVAAAFVIRAYVLSPIPLWALRKLIQIDIGTYLQQYVIPLIGSLVMIALILGLKYILGQPDSFWLLCVYTLAGGLTYLLVVQLTAPLLSHQVLGLVRLALPNLKWRKV